MTVPLNYNKIYSNWGVVQWAGHRILDPAIQVRILAPQFATQGGSMNKIVECVPNFSEGRNPDVIKAITDEIKNVDNVVLLDVDPGEAANRTVVTFAGDPDGIKEAAFRAIKKALELIDMTKHKGEHPRLGAVDVVPFVPVKNITMEEVVKLSHEVAERVAKELHVPVYMYEYSATKPQRKSLAEIRKGEYEGLEEKLKDPEWAPDYGDAVFNPKSGAMVIGARDFLIAYNINLNTKDRKLAHKIAKEIREKGKLVKQEDGTKKRVPGKLKHVRAIGWYIDEYGIAQISINLTNYKETPLWKVFETAEEEARKLGLRVTGSEIVGLVPLDALLDTGKHFLKKQGKIAGIPEKEIVDIAIKSLGLSDVAPFEPQKKIIDYRLKDPTRERLRRMNLMEFADELSTDSPAPGGGSVSALSGALSAALSSMVANLTFGKKKYKEVWDEMDEIAQRAQELKDKYLEFIDKDTEAFSRVMDAFSLPKKTEEDKKIREEAIESATKEATLVPLSVLRETQKLLELAEVVAEKGNINSVSDAGVAAIFALSAAKGAYLNVIINTNSLKDREFATHTNDEAKKILNEVETRANKVFEYVAKKISES